jgi:hypothetical protein
MRRGLPLVVAVYVLVGAAAAHGESPASPHVWQEAVTPMSPLPEKTGVFVDMVFQRLNAGGQPYVSIEESIALAAAVNDQAEESLTGVHWTMALQHKYFVASYRTGEQLVAERDGGETYKKAAPIHIDPTVCHGAKATADTVALLRAVREAIGGDKKALPVDLTRRLAARFQVDTLVFLMVVSCRGGNPSPAAGTPGDAFDRAASAAAVVVRAVDGAVLYRAVSPIAEPQRENTIRHAVTEALGGLPRREKQPAYPIPSMPKIEATPPPDADAEDAPPAKPRRTPASTDTFAGRSARLTGDHPIAITKRPNALSPLLFEAMPGTSVRIVERSGDWFLIALPNGLVGWAPLESMELP